MKAVLTFLLAAMAFISAHAGEYAYSFDNTPVAEAVIRICKDHPEVNISFIYKELDNYRTSAKILTDDPYEALCRTVGHNPISVIKKRGNYYIEALQRGKYRYFGRVAGADGEPVAGATVMLLAPADSTVITYGVADDTGRFSIPCDKRGVLGKVSCVGYRTAWLPFDEFATGTITLAENTVTLNAVTVQSENAILYADKSVYLPTSRQKNAAQTAQDLIMHMAIPQLRIGEELKTTTGQPVSLYIDYIPATEGELSGMRIADVKRVEYYDCPIDPRFQGNPHVINFIMQKYEYGGYVKGLANENIAISRQLNGYAKVQYKKMTYDWTAVAFNLNDRGSYTDTREWFRLPQPDGTVKDFERTTDVTDSKSRRDTYWTSFKALYHTEKVSVSNMLTAEFDRQPVQRAAGTVSYTPADFATTDYATLNSSRINSFVYSGYWYFSLPHGNTITFDPRYAYTHTVQSSSYSETGIDPIYNGAVDDSHRATGDLTFTHSFGKGGTLKALCKGEFLQTRTHYSGTSTVSDKARLYRVGPGVNYSYANDKLYTNAGLGLYWDKSVYGSITENSVAPWARLYLQYAFSTKNSVWANFDYHKWQPKSSFRSASVIKADPLMSYTGNPGLVPTNSFSTSAGYTFIPNNKYTFSLYGRAWFIGHRYVYDYEAGPTGILRTIKQPMGSYSQWQYGLEASTKQFDGNLQIEADLYVEQAHNGAPYNWTRTGVTATVSAYYYWDNVYLGAMYSTPTGYADGYMVGTWMEPRSYYSFRAGWSNKHWKLMFYTRNPFRHGDRQSKGSMQSRYYDRTDYNYSSFSSFCRVSAIYTFAFGKKVKADDEAYKASGASSGILK